jgi:putative transposase
MRGPKPPAVELSAEMRQGLEELVRRHQTPQRLALRARMILLAAGGQNNARIARALATTVDSVRLWRVRWLGFEGLPLDELSVAERLEDAPRPGKPPTIGAEQVCRIVALACEAPEASGRPISQWTGQEIADEIVRRGIVESISPRHASRLLKRGICSRIVFATG